MKKILLLSILITPLLYGPELIPERHMSEFENKKPAATQEGATIKRQLGVSDQNSYHLLRHGMMIV